MKKYHQVENVKFEGNFMVLHVDGSEFRIDLRKQSKRLCSANEKERSNFVISGSGYGIHWPDIDEDLSIDGLLGITNKKYKQRAAMNTNFQRGRTLP